MDRAIVHPTGAAVAEPRPPPSLRVLLYGWFGLLGLLSLTITITLMVTSGMLHRATEEAVRDATEVGLASRVGVELLELQRQRILLEQSPAAELRARHEEAAHDLERLVPLGLSTAEGTAAVSLWRAVSRDVNEVLRLHRSERDGAARRARPLVDRAVANLDALVARAEAGLYLAVDDARRLDREADAVGIVALVLLGIGVAVVLVGGRRYVVRPLLQLRAALLAFRAGEKPAPLGEAGSREMMEVGQAFEELVGSLARAREAQLSFLAGVAHDLRNPLSALKMAVQVIASDASAAQRARTLDLMDRQVDRLARMVDDLLDATRIEAGRLELRVARFDLRDAVRDVVRLYEPTALRHELVLDLPPKPAVIEGDSLRIEQIVSNLVSNAIKYSPAGGPVNVVVVPEPDGWVRLEVTDRGIGIPREHIPDLFEPFRRRARDVAHGAGLGLSVVRRIVSAHGGTIDVESTPGRGSTFRVRLPPRVPKA